MRVAIVLAAAWLAAPLPAFAAAKDVRYAPPAAWVLPPPKPTAAPDPQGAARMVYADTQVRVTADGDETYSAIRTKILSPEGLALGNLHATWSPDTNEVTVHFARIIRDGQTIDALADGKFQVIQREAELEQSTLSGQLTAVLQVPGLRVGDEIEFGATVTHHDPTWGAHVAGLGQLPAVGTPGAFRYRLNWPDTHALRWKTTSDLSGQPARSGNGQDLTFELRDPDGAILTGGAPVRYNLRRLIQYSDFGDWTDLSRQFWPLFDKAAALSPNSPVRAEAQRIAQITTDPAHRAELALALVQDRIRYVFVGLDNGNYRPAMVDQTWERRYGDCKAKTALLLALLRELGIDAEPVLVNLAGGDGTDQVLPMPTLFNHVLVRAQIGGKSYWLDGTRLGEKTLDAIAPPEFRWGLPLRTAGAPLEPVPPQAPKHPQYVEVLDIDATAGYDQPAKVKARQVLRGSEVQQMRLQLSSISANDASRMLKNYWAQNSGWIQPDTAAWRFDEASGALVLDVTGFGQLDWDGDKAQGHSLSIFGAGFSPPSHLIRPTEQDQTAPWMTDFPTYRCWATTLRLPTAGPKRHWGYTSDPMNRVLGGVGYWRAAALTGNVMRTVMSRRVLVPEISAAEARALNAAIPRFDNKQSLVFEVAAADKPLATRPAPFMDTQDWVGADSPCQAPAPSGASSPK